MGYTYNMSGVAAKVRSICESRGLGTMLAKTAELGMSKYVPYRTGQLQRSSSTEPFHIYYSTPYARRVFFGEHLRFSKEHNPNARARWDRGYADAFGKSLGNAGTQYLRSL